MTDEMYDGLDERTRNELKLEAAEARVAELERKLTNADRLAEAVRSMNVARSADTENVTEWVAGYQSADAEIREALAAYEAGEPVVHPDTSGGGAANTKETTCFLQDRSPTHSLGNQGKPPIALPDTPSDSPRVGRHHPTGASMLLLTHRQPTTPFFREFRFDMRFRSKRYEICRFPDQEIRLQWVTEPKTGDFWLWWGAWRLVIFNIRARRPSRMSGQG